MSCVGNRDNTMNGQQRSAAKRSEGEMKGRAVSAEKIGVEVHGRQHFGMALSFVDNTTRVISFESCHVMFESESSV
jgi:hypothetical protein